MSKYRLLLCFPCLPLLLLHVHVCQTLTRAVTACQSAFPSSSTATECLLNRTVQQGWGSSAPSPSPELGWCDSSWGWATQWETLQIYGGVNTNLMQGKSVWEGRWEEEDSPSCVQGCGATSCLCWVPLGVCRMAGLAGTSFNKTALPPACLRKCCLCHAVDGFGFDFWTSPACPAISGRLCPSLKEPENTEWSGIQSGFSTDLSKDRAMPKAWFSLQQHVI